MDLRVLEYFRAAVRTGSVTAAARACHVTQPTVSRQLQELEEEVGAVLLERSVRGITPTPAGRLFLRRAEEALALVRRMKDEVRERDAVEGTVAVGAAETPAMRFVAREAARFARSHPRTRFAVRTMDWRLLEEGLAAGTVELGVTVYAPDSRRWSALPLPGAARWGLMTPRGGPLEGRDCAGPEDLRRLPLIVSQHPLESGLLDDWIGAPLSSCRIPATFTLFANGMALAQAGMGHLLTLEGAGEPPADSGFRFVPLSPETGARSFLVHRRDRPLSRPSQAFWDAVRAAL